MKEIFDFNNNIKKNLLYLFIGGAILTLFGLYSVINYANGHEEISHAVDNYNQIYG